MVKLKKPLHVRAWGNSKAVRIPISVIELIELNENDELELEVNEAHQIILTKVTAKKDASDELTMEELFSKYDGGSFNSELQEFEAKGNEQW